MDENRQRIIEAINSENLELLKELLPSKKSLWTIIQYYLRPAIDKGNMQIFHLLLEKLPSIKKPHWFYNRDYELLTHIPSTNIDEDKKVEMIQCLLPHFCEEDPNRPGFYPALFSSEDLINMIDKSEGVLRKFFINTFYAEKYNSLHSLIQRLQETVDDCLEICTFLHDDLPDIRNFFLHEPEVGHMLHKILMKNTRESMQLAVELLQVLADKVIREAAFSVCIMMDLCGNVMPLDPFPNEPLLIKLWFQLFYNSINDETQDKIYTIMLSFFGSYKGLPCLKNWSKNFLNPFVSKPLYMVIPSDKRDDLPSISEQNGIRSLQELSRDVIRNQVFQNVSNVRKFMDRIWGFNLPIEVKCFLLYIPDPAWMDNLQVPQDQHKNKKK